MGVIRPDKWVCVVSDMLYVKLQQPEDHKKGFFKGLCENKSRKKGVESMEGGHEGDKLS